MTEIDAWPCNKKKIRANCPRCSTENSREVSGDEQDLCSLRCRVCHARIVVDPLLSQPRMSEIDQLAQNAMG